MGHELERLVECYSGSAYAEAPRLLRWEGQQLPVEAVDAQWRTPHNRIFRVRTHGGRRFMLTYSEVEDAWQAEEV